MFCTFSSPHRWTLWTACVHFHAGLRIRIQSGQWIRIRIRIWNPDPDPGGQKLPTKVEKNWMFFLESWRLHLQLKFLIKKNLIFFQLWIFLNFWSSKPMDEGIERDNTSGGGGLPMLPGLYLSTFQPSQRGFFRVHTSMWREREPEPEFSNFSGPQAPIPQNWQIGFGNPLSSCYTRTTLLVYAGGTDSLEIFALFKSLKIRALENYCISVCYVTFSLTPSGLNLCQIVKTVQKTLDTLIFLPNIHRSKEHQINVKLHC